MERHCEFDSGRPAGGGVIQDHHDDRRFPFSVESNPSGQSGEWHMGRGTHSGSHKCLRALGCVPGSETFPAVSSGTACSDKYNSTAVASINRQGGTRSPQLHKLARQIIVWSSSFLPSSGNTHAGLSRGNPLYGERTLHPQVVKQIWQRYGRAAVDLFASWENTISAYCTSPRQT